MKHYKFYTSSEKAWHGIIESAEQAEYSIYLEMYIFSDDTNEAKKLIEILCAKATRGVRVRMVLDGFGSFALSNDASKMLRDAGVELIFFRRLFRTNHRKIIIIDERVGFIGGANIHKIARKWHDVFIRLEGSIVASLVRSFARMYVRVGGTDPLLLSYKKKAPLGRTGVWLFEHLPFIHKPRLREQYTKILRGATERVTILTPYFFPQIWLIKLFRELRARNVAIEIIVPFDADVAIATRANRYYMNLLEKDGLVCYQTKTMNHGKLIIVDNKLACVGSQNIDSFSFNHLAEAGICFTDQDMITELEGIVLVWKTESIEFKEKLHFTLWDKIVSSLFRFFYQMF